MENSTKNKTTAKNQARTKEDEIKNVLLIKEQRETNESTGNDEDIVYELVENESINNESLYEQIKQLQQNQESMAEQLNDAFAASNKLARQLKKERQVRRASMTSYVALTMASLALIIGIAAAFFTGSLQSEMTKLKNTIATLKNHQHQEKNITAVDAKYIHARIDDLAIKLDKSLVENVNVQEIIPSKKPQDNLIKQLDLLTTNDKPEIKNEKPSTSNLSTTSELKPPVLTNLLSKEKSIDKNANKEKRPLINQDDNINKASDKLVLAPEVLKNKIIKQPNTQKTWVVALGSYKNASTATRNANNYRNKGVTIIISKVNRQEQVWHRLLTKPFVSKQKASTYAEQVKRKLDIKTVWVIKR